jgi:hypothetical protein
MNQSAERRLFQRIKFVNDAALSIDDQHFSCRLMDLSLKGALVSVAPGCNLSIGQKGRLSFDLGDPAHLILMEVEVAHLEQTHLGLHCLHIDVDSISHLRRLIELNMGDAESLNRELKSLIQGQ